MAAPLQYRRELSSALSHRRLAQSPAGDTSYVGSPTQLIQWSKDLQASVRFGSKAACATHKVMSASANSGHHSFQVCLPRGLFLLFELCSVPIDLFHKGGSHSRNELNLIRGHGQKPLGATIPPIRSALIVRSLKAPQAANRRYPLGFVVMMCSLLRRERYRTLSYRRLIRPCQ